MEGTKINIDTENENIEHIKVLLKSIFHTNKEL